MCDDWKNIDENLFEGEDGKEKAKIFYEEAKNALTSINESNRNLKQQAYSLLRIVIPISIATVGFVINSMIINNMQINPVIFISFIYFVFMIIPITFLRFSISAINVFPIGNEPKNLLNVEYIKDESLAMFYLNESTTYQDRIDDARKTNEKSSRYLQRAINLFYNINLFFILSFIISSFLL